MTGSGSSPSESPSALTCLGRLARALALLLLVYWTLFAVLAPVTVGDAQTYNLGRLPIAEAGGLFHNPLWTSERQLVFPLTFDAIHLPLLHLGWGYGLPSFLCFLGLGSIAFHWLRKWRGLDAAWLGWLALLGLPTLIAQAVVTKNDVPVVFGLAVWAHALGRWREDRRAAHLLFAAAALGFAAGAKTSGAALAALAGLSTLYFLRAHRPALLGFLGASALAVLFLGSVETYIASTLRYGHPIGPVYFRAVHENHDGLRGALANSIRYAAGNFAVGVDAFSAGDPFVAQVADWCRSCLRAVGLANTGYRSGFTDADLLFMHHHGDQSSGYGPLGTLALAFGLTAVVWWRPGSLGWRFAIAGLAAWSVLCLTIGWMPWNNRFLMVPFCAWTIGLILAARGRVARWCLLAAAAYGAIVYPLWSHNKRPRDIPASITQRERQQFRELEGLRPVYQTVVRWSDDNPRGTLLFLAGSDSWVLPFLDSPRIRAQVVTLDTLPGLLEARRRAAAPTAVFVFNRGDFQRGGLPLVRLADFPAHPATALYRLSDTDAPTPTTAWTSGRYADGWSELHAALAVKDWAEDRLELELWNPTPLARQVSIASSLEPALPPLALAAGERRLTAIRVAPQDSVTFAITPPFAPGQGETRALGLHISVR